MTGTICRCGLASSYHDGRIELDHDYSPRPERPEAEMAATAGDEDPDARYDYRYNASENLTARSTLRFVLRAVLTTIRRR